MRATEDLELVHAVQAGNAEAYGELFERYQSKIYNFTYGILGNAEDARDVTQDAFVRVFEALPRKEHVEFSAYLYRAARNAAYDVTRARGRFDGAAEDMDFVPESSMYADPERATLFCEQQEVVRDAMSALSDDHRAILMLREVQELSYQQIADALDMTRTNVGVTIMRARLKFKGAFRMSHVDVDALCAECQAMLPKLSAYIDDELKEDERAKVEAHLDDCPLCRYALDEMREASRSYRAFIPLIPPEAMKAEILWRASHPDASLDGRAGDGAEVRGETGSGQSPESGADILGEGADGRGDGADEGVSAAGEVSLSMGAKIGIGMGVLAALAIALIIAGLLSMPAEWIHPVVTWGLWRGHVRGPAAVTAPADPVPSQQAESEEAEAEDIGTGTSAGGASQPPTTMSPYYYLRLYVPPPFFLLVPTSTAAPY
jgi:RNA polymerase sigma factor (sigma-70 family)